MTDLITLKTCSIQEFYNILHSLNGIAPLNAKIIHKLLCDMQKDLSLDAQKVLYIYFSLLDDGNTRLALDPATALEKWMLKWNSLIKLSRVDQTEYPFDLQTAKHDFNDILTNGIADLLNNYDNIIEDREPNEQSDPEKPTKPLVRVLDDKTQIKYFYATRYFDAKCIIERKASDVFKPKAHEIPQSDKDKCINFFIPLRNNTDEPIILKDRQLEAIIRGQTENLIITGGPGTGKTTVICFLLWKLLSEHPDMLSWEIKLAAPSGKAADRMRESLLENLKDFKDHSSEIYKKLHNLESYTLHRLLSYNPVKNQFNYNAQNHFPKNYIFVIDEASMIDIDLFARFMEALPDENFRLFILGDPDQLPSVEAGAVLGEMLKTGDYAVKLNESHRFNMDSEIGKLSIAIQHTKDPDTAMRDHWPTDHTKPVFQTLQTPDFNQDKSDIINYLTLPDDKKSAESELEKLIKAWTDQFYIKPQFIDRARKTYVRTSNDHTELIDDNGQPVSRKTLDELWKVTESARILSAERKGITGVQELNALVRKCLNIKPSEPFFVGQLLMLTENQSTLKLYNGDCGIVLGEKDSGRLHLMLKKARTQTTLDDNETDHTIDYVTYPLSVLPQKTLESAFAITIHKSQGSGYNNIMMFLPTTVGHPLLNNQMIYTGVTRTKKQSLTIVTTQEAFEAGCKTAVERDTGIDISKKPAAPQSEQA